MLNPKSFFGAQLEEQLAVAAAQRQGKDVPVGISLGAPKTKWSYDMHETAAQHIATPEKSTKSLQKNAANIAAAFEEARQQRGQPELSTLAGALEEKPSGETLFNEKPAAVLARLSEAVLCRARQAAANLFVDYTWTALGGFGVKFAPNTFDADAEDADDRPCGVALTETPGKPLPPTIVKGMSLHSINDEYVGSASFNGIYAILKQGERPLTMRFIALGAKADDTRPLPHHATVEHTWERKGPLGIHIEADASNLPKQTSNSPDSDSSEDSSEECLDDKPTGVVLTETPGPPLPMQLQAGWKLAAINGANCMEKSFHQIAQLLQTGFPLHVVFRDPHPSVHPDDRKYGKQGQKRDRKGKRLKSSAASAAIRKKKFKDSPSKSKPRQDKSETPGGDNPQESAKVKALQHTLDQTKDEVQGLKKQLEDFMQSIKDEKEAAAAGIMADVEGGGQKAAEEEEAFEDTFIEGWEELKEEAEDVFKLVSSVDGNDEGMSRDEMVAATDGNHELFHTIDTDDDGTVTIEEWHAFLQNLHSKKGEAGDKTLNRILQTMKKNIRDHLEEHDKEKATRVKALVTDAKEVWDHIAHGDARHEAFGTLLGGHAISVTKEQLVAHFNGDANLFLGVDSDYSGDVSKAEWVSFVESKVKIKRNGEKWARRIIDTMMDHCEMVGTWGLGLTLEPKAVPPEQELAIEYEYEEGPLGLQIAPNCDNPSAPDAQHRPCGVVILGIDEAMIPDDFPEDVVEGMIIDSIQEEDVTKQSFLEVMQKIQDHGFPILVGFHTGEVDLSHHDDKTGVHVEAIGKPLHGHAPWPIELKEGMSVETVNGEDCLKKSYNAVKELVLTQRQEGSLRVTFCTTEEQHFEPEEEDEEHFMFHTFEEGPFDTLGIEVWPATSDPHSNEAYDEPHGVVLVDHPDPDDYEETDEESEEDAPKKKPASKAPYWPYEIEAGMMIDQIDGEDCTHWSYNEFMEYVEEAEFPLELRFHLHAIDIEEHMEEDAYEDHVWHDDGPLGIALVPACHNPQEPGAEDEPFGVLLANTPGPETGFPEWVTEGMKVEAINDRDCSNWSYSKVMAVIKDAKRPLKMLFHLHAHDLEEHLETTEGPPPHHQRRDRHRPKPEVHGDDSTATTVSEESAEEDEEHFAWQEWGEGPLGIGLVPHTKDPHSEGAKEEKHGVVLVSHPEERWWNVEIQDGMFIDMFNSEDCAEWSYNQFANRVKALREEDWPLWLRFHKHVIDLTNT